jgi:hypothetical protein
MPPASALSVLGKKSSSSFDLPTAEKLEGDTAGDAAQDAANNPDLAPLKLSDTKPEGQAATTGATTDAAPTAGADGTFNASVTTNTYMPKGPLEGENAGLLSPTSMKGSKTKSIDSLGSGGSLSEQARSVNLAPLPLMDSSADSERKLGYAEEIEREQLTSLWEAALSKSPEINFVLQKLMPNSDPSKATTVMMRMLGMAMQGGISAATMMSPTPMGYAAGNGAASVLGNLMGMVESNQAKKARLTQTEQIMLFDMVRKNADKLVGTYRDYKTKHKSLYKANADFEDLKNLAIEVKKDGAKEFEVQYTLKKQERDIDEIGNQLSKERKALCDLAGEDAVAKLDASIDEEFKQLHPELAPTETIAAPSTETPGSESLATPAPDAAPQVNQEPGTETHKVAEKPSKMKGSDSKPAFKLPI